MENETAAQYRQLFSEDVSALQYKLYQKLGIYPLAFTYPFGEISPESVEVLKELGFRAALTCYERVNHLTGDPEELYALGRFNRPGQISTSEFMAKLEKE